MVLISAGIIVGLILIFQLAGIGRKAYVFSGESAKDRLKHFLYPAAFLLIHSFRNLSGNIRGDSGRNSYYERIYVGEDSDRVREKCEADIVSMGLLILLITCVTAIAIVLSGSGNNQYFDTVNRPERGESQLDVTAEYGGDEFNLTINVDERYPTQEEMLERIKSVEDMLEVNILGQNESLLNVTGDLELKEIYEDESVKVSWQSSDVNLVHSDGRVDNQNLAEAQKVELVATISCFEESREMTIDVIVEPENEESAKRALVVDSIDEVLETAAESQTVKLPDSVQGEEIRFKYESEDSGGTILLTGVLVSLLLIPLWFENRRNKLAERDAELICDYAEVLGKFSMLLEAGLTIRVTFERMASDYEKRKTAKNHRYVYEEMLKTCNELRLGKSEREAYEDFGRRCGNIFYIRFAALLVQHVKKGGESLIPQLHKEASESMKERQQAVRKKGEEASMKLMFPMMTMFAIILVIILVPAFLTI